MNQRYSLTSIVRDGVETFVLEEKGVVRAAVAPTLGANCYSLEAHLPILESVEFTEFRRKPTSWGIPLLFPFPNRIRDGVFMFQGERFTVDPPRHGFVRDKAFEVLDAGASNLDGAWVRSEVRAADYPREILDQFPFPFTFEVTHRIRNGAMEIDVIAENTGERTMPAGFGIHPYFRRPRRGSLEVPAAKRWELVDNLPTGRRLDLDPLYDLRGGGDVAGLQLDDIYTDCAADASGNVQCFLDDLVNQTRTVVEFPRSQFPHVVVYTPPAPRSAICVEPISCPTDAFNLQPQGIEADLIELKPGRKAAFHVRVFARELP